MEELALFVGSFALGIFLRSVFIFHWPVFIFALMLAALVASAAFLGPRRVYSLAAISLALVLCGMLRTALAEPPLPSTFAAELKERVALSGVVTSDPDVRDANQRFDLAVTQNNQHVTILVEAPRYPEVVVGERVSAYGTLEVPQAFAEDDGRIFRYDQYLAAKGVRLVMSFASVRILAPPPWYSLSALFARVKHVFLGGIDATLPEPIASLAGGVVIGGKSGLGTDLLAAFTLSGLVQIIVLSGYNVMIIAEGVMAALAALTLKKKTAAALGAAAVLLFVLIAGASSTALRAGLMALIALYARATGRSYAAGRALLVVAFLMLLYNPLLLAFDPSFELSVAATAGVIWLSPVIELRLARLKSAFWRNALATTLAAQLSVLPLLLYDTGNLSLIAVPANLLVLPIVPAAMAASALAGLAGMVLGSFALPFSIALAFPAYFLNRYIILVAQGAAKVPFAALHLTAFPFWLVALAYAALIYIAFANRASTKLQFTLSKKASM